MWSGTANSGGWRSPQASAGIPNNTRELERSGKKKPQPRTVGVLLLVVLRRPHAAYQGYGHFDLPIFDTNER